MDLTTLTSSPGRKLALGLGAALVVGLALVWFYYCGYRHGVTTATDKGDAKYARLQKEHADALAQASAKALDRYDQEAQRADEIAADLITARQRLAATRTLISKEISHATAGLDACFFGPDFLRVYGQALGYGPGGLPEAPGSGGAAPNRAAAPTTGAGLR